MHTAHPQAVQHSGPGFGRLLSPRHFARIADTAAAGIPWAADNDCYQGLDPHAYRAMLTACRDLPGCLFVVVPDVVADWRATRRMWRRWRGAVADLPAAYVAQDGQPAGSVPWADMAALFVGGSTEYKLSAAAADLVREARSRELWTHMGRVNSRRRFTYARQIGINSVDGTSYSRWRDRWLPDALRWHTDHLQERLPI